MFRDNRHGGLGMSRSASGVSGGGKSGKANARDPDMGMYFV
jgi:hypothetical protein